MIKFLCSNGPVAADGKAAAVDDQGLSTVIESVPGKPLPFYTQLFTIRFRGYWKTRRFARGLAGHQADIPLPSIL